MKTFLVKKLILTWFLFHSISAIAQFHGPMKGSWSASISNEGILIRFDIDGDDDSRSSTYFSPAEFSSIPKMEKQEFTITRQAGTVKFNGKFDKNQGSGSWAFTPDKDYIESMKTYGIVGLVDHEWFVLFTMNIKKDYPQMLKDNGYSHISKNDLILLGSMKVDEKYIQYWIKNGYVDLSIENLVMLKNQHITVEYFESFTGLVADKTSLRQMIDLKVVGIDPPFAKSFVDAGLKDIHIYELRKAKEAGVTAEYVTAMKKKGANYSSLAKYIELKKQD